MPPPGFTTYAVKRNDGSIFAVDAIDIDDLFQNRIGEGERTRVQLIEPYDPKAHLRPDEYEKWVGFSSPAAIVPMLSNGHDAPTRGLIDATVRQVLRDMSADAKPIVMDDAIGQVEATIATTGHLSNVDPDVAHANGDHLTEVEATIDEHDPSFYEPPTPFAQPPAEKPS